MAAAAAAIHVLADAMMFHRGPIGPAGVLGTSAGVQEAAVELESKTVTMRLDASVSDDTLKAAVEDARYMLVSIQVNAVKAKRGDVARKLKIARGQLDGILQIIEEDRCCVDIPNQIMATQALLKSAKHQILQAHIRSCVRETP